MTKMPDPSLAVARYHELASNYDRATRRAASVRERAVAALDLRPGDTVLDVACGTGACFSLLEEKIGSRGSIVGVELSPDMLSLARKRVESAGWKNVTLIESSMESAVIPSWDAALFHYTQDVLRSPKALSNIFASAKNSARVALAGTKLFPWWLSPLNIYVRVVNRNYMTTTESLNRPWSLLQSDYIPDLNVRQIWLGASYIARGVYRRNSITSGSRTNGNPS
ncbi:MAG: methyltransferase domain-containing protein [Elusimicrobia bacterium]|nr:methyltransferase domain-containing protein [Elusimicrobiota bacterium]MDE2312690.1 methyltransferase domain-containing protein [Elusimicrobiota bacterium]